MVDNWSAVTTPKGIEPVLRTGNQTACHGLPQKL